VWHASVAVQSLALGRTLGVDDLTEGMRATAITAAKGLLAGVGMVPSAVEQHPVAIHYRRSLTVEEYSALPAAWCAIAAIHQAGRGLVLEENT
jgi:hypothetical protein